MVEVGSCDKAIQHTKPKIYATLSFTEKVADPDLWQGVQMTIKLHWKVLSSLKREKSDLF